MRYLNLRLLTLLATGLSFVAVPALFAQDPARSPAAAPIRGDVDGDGRVTSRDAEAVRAYLVRGTAPAGGAILPAGDANGDGRITSADAVLISRFAAGVDVSRFGVGRPVGAGGAQEPAAGGRVLAVYECTAEVAAGRVSCAPAAPDAGGARLDLVLGAPNVTIASTGNVLSRDGVGEDTTTTSVTVRNNIGQPIGTTDGTNAASTGTRLFFNLGPTVASVNSGTIAGSTVRVDNQEGIATFSDGGTTYPDKKYFQYDGVLATNATSAAEAIRFVYSANVKTFKFGVLVSAPVQYEQGWITVTPPTADLAPGGTVALSTASFGFTGAAIASDPVTWSSSDPAVATVDASGLVTGVGSGSATITATSNSTPQRTGRAVVIVDAAPTVASTTPANGGSSVSPGADIQIVFSEAVTVAESSFQLECPAGSAVSFTVGGSGTGTITLDPATDLPSGITCQVTVLAAGVSDADTNDGLDKLAVNYVFSFDVSIEAVVDAFGTTTTGNVRIHSDATSPAFSVTTNDKVPASATISFAGWNGTPGKTQNGGDVSMTTSGAGRGQFIYNPPAGFDGTDSLQYTVQVGSMTSSAKVALPVSGMIWFVNNAGASCASRANGCGRLTTPYSSLAAFNAENNGSGNNPAAGDAVFLYESASAYTGPVTLLGQQKLIGQDAGASLSTVTGITPATGSDALPAMNTGGNAVTIAGASGGVVLGADNLLRGFAIATTGGTALAGTGFGTPNIAEVPISATGGAALSLDNGTLNSTFPSVSSTNSTGRGISLTGVSGSPTFTAGSISGAAQAAFFVSAGNVGFTWPGSIGQANNAPVVDVQGSHTGTLTFSGALTATNGTGLQFNAALGTYTFSGSASLGGTDAGVDITNGSTGTFNFNASTQITNTAGTGVNVYGSAPTVTYSGNITKSGTSTGRLVEVGEQTGGTVTFNTGTLLANSTNALSTGISLSNADGAVSFNGTTTLGGGDAGVDIVSGSGGTMTFAAGTSITNPSGTAINVNSSTPNLTFSGSITKSGTSAGRLVDISGQTGGGSVALNNTITFTGGTLSSTSSAGTGILLSDVDGTVNFSGTTTLNGGDAGVDVEGGSGGVIAFASGASITNPTNELVRVVSSAPTFTYAGSLSRSTGGAGILAQNNTGGTLLFSGATKTLNTGASNAVSLLTNTGTTIQFTNGNLDIDVTTGAGFNATGGGTVEVTGTLNTVTSTAGGRAVNIQNTTIGAGNVTFRNVTGTGAASGVRVENTGLLGGIKITGDGSTASSGGIITMNNVTAADSAAYTLTNTANVSLEFVRVEVTTGNGAGGIAATNLQGTNLVRNSVFDYNQTAPAAVPLHNAYAMYFAQTSTNGTITVDGSSVNGTRAGSSAGVLSARGSSAVNFNVVDSNTGDGFQSLFTDLFGSAWVIASGDGGSSSAVVNLTVRDSRFTNAAANGSNNLEMGVSSNATMNYKVKDNLFQNVANASCICGIINVNTADAGVFGANTAMDSIVGNTITNTGTGAVATTDLGYIPMRIAFDNSSATTNRVVIANNVITDSWRQGILLSTRQNSTGNFKLVNNTVGTAALPVGQSNRRGIETDLQQSSVMNLEMTGNNVTGAGTVDAAASVGLRVGTDVSGSATLNATVLSNTIRSTNGGNNGRFRAEASATSPGTICLDLRSNNLDDNARLYTLTHNGGTFRVEGAGAGAVSNAAIQAANTAGNGNVSGTVLFNNGANCTQPPI